VIERLDGVMTVATTNAAAHAARTRKSPAAGPRSAAPKKPAKAAGGPAAVVRGVARPAEAVPGGPPPDLTLNRAREELGLDFGAFELALETGEIATVRDGTGRQRVPAAEVARIRRAAGGPEALAERIELVNTTVGAELLGISRDRLLRLTRAGRVWPARWYVNRYRAVVWLYLAGELRDFATGNPALLAGRLPDALRAEAAEGPDLRPRCWRIRQVAHLVREAQDPWEEAAIWAAVLGPEVVADAVPDPYERSRLRTLHPELPHGRPGVLADAALVRRMTTADAPDEVATALLALSDALARARLAAPVLLPPPPPTAPVAAAADASPSLPAQSDVRRGRRAVAPVPERASQGDRPSCPPAAAARPAKVPRPRSGPGGSPAPAPAPESGTGALRAMAGGVRAPGAGSAGSAGGVPGAPPRGRPAGRGERAPLAAGTAVPSARALRSLRRLLRKGRQPSAG
jgi:hypothetical protein